MEQLYEEVCKVKEVPKATAQNKDINTATKNSTTLLKAIKTLQIFKSYFLLWLQYRYQVRQQKGYFPRRT